MRTIDARTGAGRKELEKLLAARRATPDFRALRDVLPVVEEVLRKGRAPLARFVRRFDGVSLRPKDLLVDPSRGPVPAADPAFVRAFRQARRRIEAYHRRQLPKGFAARDALGVRFVEAPVPLDAVGVYVPGGRAFYPSSLLMGVVPAQVAGVPRIVVATPPRAVRTSPELRWALRELGIRDLLLAGGAHGIAGLVSVAGCAKVVGPGNRYVAAAKHLVSSLVSVDLPAGPSEVLIVASAGARADLVAADLLAQAEHDPDAVCLVFTNSERLARAVARETESQIGTFPERSVRSVMRAALRKKGAIALFPTIGTAVAAGRRAAVEHVQVMGRSAERAGRGLLATAGALFLGSATPTAFGDYVAGPNHVLPTGGAARSFSGLSVRDFLRWGRSVEVPPRAARRIGPAAAALARLE
ncbi:MAG TPA: histidinol dehydrogenase, partial [Thermoanaerobaculia bacterium]|nr:histidinol dehydrogenase [Thermoanaerobaculia bacterium]